MGRNSAAGRSNGRPGIAGGGGIFSTALALQRMVTLLPLLSSISTFRGGGSPVAQPVQDAAVGETDNLIMTRTGVAVGGRWGVAWRWARGQLVASRDPHARPSRPGAHSRC